MVKSRSGPIRQSIGPRKTHLQVLIQSCKSLKEEIAKVKEGDVETLIMETEELIAKLETSVEGLEASDSKWQELIENLAPEEVADEDDIYQDFVSAADNHLRAVDEGRESLSVLRVSLTRLNGRTKAKEQKTINSEPLDLPQQRKGASKLPKLSLPVYDGDELLWSQFWAIFEANIHDTNLRAVEKLTYLHGQLTGNALRTIAGLEICDSSYQVAIDLLKKRFQRTPEKVINDLYGQLKRLPLSSSNIDDLQTTFDGCERVFRQLKTEGEDVDNNRSLVMDVMSKYPPDVLTELSRRHPTQKLATVSQVQSAFREFIDESRTLQGMLNNLEPFGAKSKSKSTNYTTSNTSSPGRFDSKTDGVSITSALTSSDRSTNVSKGGQPTQPCYFCHEIHFNSQCTAYPNVESRETRLDQLKRCRRCLSDTHLVKDCRTRPQRIRCFFCNQSGLHVSPLCPTKFGKGSTKDDEGGQSLSINTSSALCAEEQAVLSTAVTNIVDPATGSKRRVRLIMDCGSHRSYVTEAVAREFNPVSGGTESLQVAVFGSKRSLSVTTRRVEIHLELRDGSTKLINAHTTPIITNFSLSPGPLPESTRQLVSTLQQVMADDLNAKAGPPDILIGSDYFWEFINGSRIQTDDGIYLIPSKLGLILGGRYSEENAGSKGECPSLLCLTERQPLETNVSASCLTANSRDSHVEPDLDEFWSMERIGISDCPVEKDDDIAQRYFNDTVEFKNGRYSVRWPWKKQKSKLPTNYQLAMGRFKPLARRLEQDDNMRNEYNKVIDDQISRGVIEEVPISKRMASNNMVHYLPHHPVVRVDSNTTKVRIVYDASARININQPCLNECMYRGPVVLPDLCSILIRFRIKKIAMVADIEKAYLQLSLHEEDRDVTRFLWFQDPSKPDVQRVTMYRFVRVPFGVISSQFLLGATVHHHLNRYDTPTATMIDKNTYVDNAFLGAVDAETGKCIYKEAKEIFMDAGLLVD